MAGLFLFIALKRLNLGGLPPPPLPHQPASLLGHLAAPTGNRIACRISSLVGSVSALKPELAYGSSRD